MVGCQSHVQSEFRKNWRAGDVSPPVLGAIAISEPGFGISDLRSANLRLRSSTPRFIWRRHRRSRTLCRDLALQPFRIRLPCASSSFNGEPKATVFPTSADAFGLPLNDSGCGQRPRQVLRFFALLKSSSPHIHRSFGCGPAAPRCVVLSR